MNPKIKELHEHENEFNREMGIIDKEISRLQKRKAKLKKQISNNMRYVNKVLLKEAGEKCKK